MVYIQKEGLFYDKWTGFYYDPKSNLFVLAKYEFASNKSEESNTAESSGDMKNKSMKGLLTYTYFHWNGTTQQYMELSPAPQIVKSLPQPPHPDTYKHIIQPAQKKKKTRKKKEKETKNADSNFNNHNNNNNNDDNKNNKNSNTVIDLTGDNASIDLTHESDSDTDNTAQQLQHLESSSVNNNNNITSVESNVQQPETTAPTQQEPVSLFPPGHTYTYDETSGTYYCQQTGTHYCFCIIILDDDSLFLLNYVTHCVDFFLFAWFCCLFFCTGFYYDAGSNLHTDLSQYPPTLLHWTPNLQAYIQVKPASGTTDSYEQEYVFFMSERERHRGCASLLRSHNFFDVSQIQ